MQNEWKLSYDSHLLLPVGGDITMNKSRHIDLFRLGVWSSVGWFDNALWRNKDLHLAATETLCEEKTFFHNEISSRSSGISEHNSDIYCKPARSSASKYKSYLVNVTRRQADSLPHASNVMFHIYDDWWSEVVLSNMLSVSFTVVMCIFNMIFLDYESKSNIPHVLPRYSAGRTTL